MPDQSIFSDVFNYRLVLTYASDLPALLAFLSCDAGVEAKADLSAVNVLPTNIPVQLCSYKDTRRLDLVVYPSQP